MASSTPLILFPKWNPIHNAVRFLGALYTLIHQPHSNHSLVRVSQADAAHAQ